MPYKTFAEYREAWDKAAYITPEAPIHIDLELSSVCNLLCPFCFLADPSHEQPRGFMPLDSAIRTINEAHRIGVPALKVNWRGESTLSPHFSRIVEYAQSLDSFHEILLNTNGNFGESALDGVMACTKVMFSLDSCREDTYKQIRVGGDLLKVLGNIGKVIKAGHENIWVRRVVTDLNKHEDFAGEVKRIYGSAVKVAEHYVFERAKKGQKRPVARVYCGYPSQRLIVAVDGSIYPCCVDYDCTMPMGQAPDLLEAWGSKGMKALRRQLKKGGGPKTCQACTSWMAYDSPKRESVKDREIK